MMFKINLWTGQQKTDLYTKSTQFKNKITSIRSTGMAILIGLLVGVIIIFLNGKNGFLFVQIMFQQAFSTISNSSKDSNISTVLNYFVVYSFMGIGLALGFKVGIFNMGGSGQAVLGFSLSMLMLMQLTGVRNGTISLSSIPIGTIISIFLIFIVSGTLISILTGVLKVFLNIHEVATSILMNWSIWYLMKWLLRSNFATPANQNLTPNIPLGLLSVGGQSWVIGFIFLIMAVFALFFLLKYTTFGFKANVVGKQITAAKYAGINDKFYIIMITALQGLFISLGAMFYYIVITRGQNISNDILPTIGFDAIAVALVASNNIFGILPIALIWGIFKVGSEAAVVSPDMIPTSKYISDVIFALIIYSSTISLLLIKFTPIYWIKIKFYLRENDRIQKIIEPINEKIKSIKSNNSKPKKTVEYKQISDRIKQLKINLLEAKQSFKLEESKDSLHSEIILQNKKIKIEKLKKKISFSKIELRDFVNSSKLKYKLAKQHLISEKDSIIAINYQQYLESKKNELIEKARKEYNRSRILNLNKIIVLKNQILIDKRLIKDIKIASKFLSKKNEIANIKNDLDILRNKRRNFDILIDKMQSLPHNILDNYQKNRISFLNEIKKEIDADIQSTYQNSISIINLDNKNKNQLKLLISKNKKTNQSKVGV